MEEAVTDVPLCLCGCRTPVKYRHGKWNRYATRKCFLSTLTKAERQANLKAWMDREPNARHILSESGSKGGRAIKAERWINLLEKWQSLGPREALQRAFYDGYALGWRARRRSENGTEAA